MSDNKTQPTPPPSPQAKTAAVPLKKETVRITLRARPGAGVTQPKELTAPVPSAMTSPVPRPMSTSVTPAPRSVTSPVTPISTSIPPRTVTSPVPAASKATSPIQLPSAPLPPPAARPATTPVPVSLAPAPSAAPRPPAPAPSLGAPPRPGGPPPAPTTVPMARAPGAPPSPGAPRPLAPSTAAPSAPRPPVPAATVPLAKSPMAPKPAGPGARVEAGATTVPLSAPKPPLTAPKGSGTAPMAKGAAIGAGANTSQLPKATVKLQQTNPMAKQQQVTPPSAPVKRAAVEPDSIYEEKDPEAGLMPLAVLCSILAVVVMAVSLLGTDKAFFANEGESSAFMVPPPSDPKWEEKQVDGTHVSTFNKTLTAISSKFE